MNIQPSVIAPARSAKRSTLQRFIAVATASALLLGVASASADDNKADRGDRGGDNRGENKAGGGTFTLTTIAGVGDSYTGKLDVKGEGKFTVKDVDGKLVFVSNVADGELNMKDGRQKHTVGDDSKLGLKKGQKVKLVIQKSALTFPEPGKEASGTVAGKFHMLGREKDVSVKYTVKEEGGKFVIKSASFDLDYTKHVSDGKKVCLMLVCVKPGVSIVITGGVIETKK